MTRKLMALAFGGAAVLMASPALADGYTAKAAPVACCEANWNGIYFGGGVWLGRDDHRPYRQFRADSSPRLDQWARHRQRWRLWLPSPRLGPSGPSRHRARRLRRFRVPRCRDLRQPEQPTTASKEEVLRSPDSHRCLPTRRQSGYGLGHRCPAWLRAQLLHDVVHQRRVHASRHRLHVHAEQRHRSLAPATTSRSAAGSSAAASSSSWAAGWRSVSNTAMPPTTRRKSSTVQNDDHRHKPVPS